MLFPKLWHLYEYCSLTPQYIWFLKNCVYVGYLLNTKWLVQKQRCKC